MEEGKLVRTLDEFRNAYHEAADDERSRDERDASLIRADRLLLEALAMLVAPSVASMRRGGAA